MTPYVKPTDEAEKSMCEKKADVEKIKSIFEENLTIPKDQRTDLASQKESRPPLTIPKYQRPYKWQIRHVQQLLNDLWQHFNENKIYRIGTIVLHSEKEKLDIVDGQQRLITLTLLLHELGYSPLDLLEQKLNHSVSHYNIKQNHQFIQHFMAENLAEHKENFKTYLLEQCQMVVIKLSDLDEAFQFFDSQNASGKPLEAYDLLKAYHLREMQAKPTAEVQRCVEEWEQAALGAEDDPNLHKIINQVLFRLRRWHYQQSGEQFSSQELDCFKGVSEQSNYPYVRQIQAAYSLFQAASVNPLYQRQFAEPIFQANQPMINGVYFFDYVQHYRQLYRQLFDTQMGLLTKIDKINSIKLGKNLIHFLDSYQHSYRTGDRYLRELFECLVLAYYDKFGEQNLTLAVNKILLWVYRLRFEFQRISFRTVEDAVWQKESLATCIEQAMTPDAVMRFSNLLQLEVKFNNVDEKFKQIFKIERETNDAAK